MRDPHRTLSRDEAGASAVEYGLLIAGIAALIVTVIFAFGGTISTVFSNSCGTVGAKINSQVNSQSCS